MNPEAGDALWDELAAILETYDEALAMGSGETSFSSAASEAEIPDEITKAKAALEFLHRVQPRGLSTSHVADCSPQSSESEVCRLGRYRIIRELGRGGFGVVHLAWDEDLERHVALKLPRAERLISERDKQRFLREGRAAASLSHPNIVTVYAAGSDGPVLYLASAYCEGISLATWLASQRDPVDVRSAAALIRKLADALQHAHDRGIIHRDVKPSNVLLEGATAESPLEKCEPRVSDFGLAKLLDGDDGGNAETREGAVLGTPAYMAPEQATGKRTLIGAATDVYALGAVLYELLTGRPPFTGDSELAILKQVEGRDVRSTRSLRGAIPCDLDAICLKCLEKRPEQRYHSCAELAADLDRFLKSEPVAARRASVVERSARWLARNRLIALLVGTAMACLCLFAGTLYVGNQRLQQTNNELLAERKKTARALDEAETNLGAARAALQEMVRQGDFRRLPMPEPRRLQAVEQAAQFYERLLDGPRVDDALRTEAARCYLNLVRLYTRSTQREARNRAIRRALDIASEQAHPDSQTHELAHFMNGAMLYEQSKYTEALAQLEISLRWNEKQTPADTVQQLSQQYQRSSTVTMMARTLMYREPPAPNQALDLLRRQETTLRGLLDRHPENVDLKAALADILWARINGAMVFPRSKEEWLSGNTLGDSLSYQEDVATQRGWSFDKYGLARLLGFHARLSLNEGRTEDARALYERQATLLKHLVTTHPDVGMYREQLATGASAIGGLYASRKEHEKSLRWFTESLAQAKWLHKQGPGDAARIDQLADALNNVGSAQNMLGEFGKAADYLAQAVALREQMLRQAPKDPAVVEDAAKGFCNLGYALFRSGHGSEALEPYARVPELANRLAGSDVSRSIRGAVETSYRARVIVLNEERRPDEAVQVLEDMLATFGGSWYVDLFAAEQYGVAGRITIEKEGVAGEHRQPAKWVAEARRRLRDALESMPPNISPFYLDSAAWLQLQIPDITEDDLEYVIELSQRLESTHGQEPRAARLRLVVASIRGDSDTVRQELPAALQISDAHRLAILRIAEKVYRQAGQDSESQRLRLLAERETSARNRTRRSLLDRLWMEQVLLKD